MLRPKNARTYPRLALALCVLLALTSVAITQEKRGSASGRLAEISREIAALEKEKQAILAVDRALGGLGGLGGLSGLADPADADLEDEQSVKPGINESWKSDQIEPLIERLESESREIHTYRETLAAVVGPTKGMVVADIGAGSGFMAMIFSRLVGAEGKVIAVDINRALMASLEDRAKEFGLGNIDTVVCGEKSVGLPDASADLIFVCDTYHHFEYPKNVLRSVHAALRDDGQLVVVDFRRIPGVSKDWMLDHVRAGEEVFTQEILDAGFRLVNAHSIPQLQENYILRFEKARPAAAGSAHSGR